MVQVNYTTKREKGKHLTYIRIYSVNCNLKIVK